MTLKTLLKATAVIAALSAAGTGGAFATNPLNTNAEVNIVAPIAITEDNPLRFGKITRPSAGTADYTVSAIDGSTSDTGDGAFIPATGKTRGSYGVSGVGGAAYTFTATIGGACTGGTGVTLTALTNNATSILNETVLVGGTINVAFDASIAAILCPYTVSASY